MTRGNLDHLKQKNQILVPGILGGLGPLAHIEFEKRLLEASYLRGAIKDQDYPFWLLINASPTPDRTQTLLEKNQKGIDKLLNYCQHLENIGADFIVIPCNTSHAFHKYIQSHLSIPWLNLITLTSDFIKQKSLSSHKVGILATTGTLKSELFQNALKQNELEPISFNPDSMEQSNVMDAIYHPEWGIKSTGAFSSEKARQILLQSTEQMRELGAQKIILGCTEISVGLRSVTSSYLELVDPLIVLAQKTIQLTFEGN